MKECAASSRSYTYTFRKLHQLLLADGIIVICARSLSHARSSCRYTNGPNMESFQLNGNLSLDRCAKAAAKTSGPRSGCSSICEAPDISRMGARLRKFRSPVSQPVRFGIPPELKHIQRLPALPAFVGPTVFEAQQAAELRQWHEEWKDIGLPETLPNELWSTFSAALQEATGTWDARSDPETCLLQLWFCALRRLQDDLGCTDELAQWFLIEWLQRDLPDVTAAWDDPDDIVEAEKEAYEAITCSPVYELLAKREKILRREPQGTQRPEPDVGPSRIPRMTS